MHLDETWGDSKFERVWICCSMSTINGLLLFRVLGAWLYLLELLFVFFSCVIIYKESSSWRGRGNHINYLNMLTGVFFFLPEHKIILATLRRLCVLVFVLFSFFSPATYSNIPPQMKLSLSHQCTAQLMQLIKCSLIVVAIKCGFLL